MLTSILALLPIALAAAAANPLIVRDDGPNCEVFGENGFANVRAFQLAAVNTTLPNANSTGVPLSRSTTGASGGGSSSSLSTFQSYPFAGSIANLTLDNGALLPLPVGTTNTSNSRLQKGDALGWVTSSRGVLPPTRVWCGVNNADGTGLPLLAVNGDIDGWNLCLVGRWENALNSLVWYPSSEGNPPYVAESCYPVRLHMLLEN